MTTPLKERVEQAAPKGTLTEYVILEFESATDDWHEQGDRVKARTPEKAIQQAHGKRTDKAVYIAVPTRSWRPVTVTVETTTQLKLT